eukprot:CAMPEP_0182422392 /NCGR_PEP_ID=MMETSP1167-20130531/8069_1 /TAXON_ID=2988 /ORGANISM="Mallomonas Sp, Strain CCMP3275" /LENGTH=705 /DNA_ID=CAMNT_0024600411 /DNA_START=348 /DNA_END=2465 /DNA_ORIENTATION=-
MSFNANGDLCGENNNSAWFRAVQLENDSVVDAVSRILEIHKSNVNSLANACDTNGRNAKNIACPRCKEAILKKLYLHGRYEVKSGPPEHKSATSLVIFAIDHNDSIIESNGLHVALKFMRNRDQFIKEVQTRQNGGFDMKYILPILSTYDGESEEEEELLFRVDAVLKGFHLYPFCIVMEAALQSLKRVIDHEHIMSMDIDEVKRMTKQLTAGLNHIHEKGVIHGDIKPLNILQVNHHLKLTDLDAAASVKNEETVGNKYSSAYVPPEMLWIDLDGTVAVRSVENHYNGSAPYDLLVAHPSQDMWSLGCVIYLLCTGTTLFHGSVEDNITDEDELLLLQEWADDTKEKKLKIVKHKLARNLLSLLLNADPKKRPTASRVLSHPFLTGKTSSRLQGEEALYDVFLSYRVSSDSKHVKMLYDELVSHGLRVWWDKECLIAGQNWEEGFCSGLVGSATFVCLLSREAIKSESRSYQNFETLKEDSRCDNVLLEWRLALDLKERGMIEGIFPVMIGDKDANGFYSNYFGSGCHPALLPDIVVESIESKVRDHLDREGLGLPYKETQTVKSIVTDITSNQGGFIQDNIEECIQNLALVIVGMVTSSLQNRPLRRNSSLHRIHYDVDHRHSHSEKVLMTEYDDMKRQLSVKHMLLQQKDSEINDLHELIHNLRSRIHSQSDKEINNNVANNSEINITILQDTETEKVTVEE